MKVNKGSKIAALLFLLMLQIIQSKLQDLVVQKQINLLRNEPFTLNLSQFVSEITYNYELQDTAGSIKIQEDFIQLNKPLFNIPGVSIIESQQLDVSLASFYNGRYQKNQIGLCLKQNTEGSYDIIIGFQVINIEQQGQNKIVKNSQVYTNPNIIDSVPKTTNLQISYASMYNPYEGLIVYTNADLSYSIYQFIFDPSTQIPQYQAIKGPKFTKHTSVVITQDNSNLIYVILYYQESINLYMLNPQTKQLLWRDTYQPSSEKIIFNLNSLSPINGYFFAYAFMNPQLYIFSVDFLNDKLTLQTIQLTNNGSFLGAQQIENYIIFIQSDGIMEFIKSGSSSSNNNTQLLLVRSISFAQVPPLHLFEPIFLSRNIFVQINYIFITIYDLSVNRMVYSELLVSDLNNKIGRVDFIQNILIFYIYKNEKLIEIRCSEANSASIGIKIQKSRQFSVIMSGGYQKVELKINVSIAEELQQSAYQITFEITNILLSNIITSPFQNEYFFLSIGQYITAPDLQLQIQQSSKQTQLIDPRIIKSLSFLPKIKLSQESILKSYQTDYVFSSIIQYNDLKISAISIKSYSNLKAENRKQRMSQNIEENEVIEYKCSQLFGSSIDIIDNYGAFTLITDKQSNTKHIYLPTICSETKQLFFYSIEVECDVTQIFKFSSDTLSSTLFVSCGSILTQYSYQIYLNKNYGQKKLNINNYVISGNILYKNQIQIDGRKYNKQICIEGLLLFWNKKNIQGYDYNYNGVYSNSINIPSSILDSQSWDILLFKHSFLIYGLSQQSSVFIYQFSYNQFSDPNALFLRALQIDETHQISSQLIIIPKRGIQEECIYVLSNQANTYFMYRMNPTDYSQNQLFTSVTFYSNSIKKIDINKKKYSHHNNSFSESDDQNFSILFADTNNTCQLNQNQISCFQILPGPFIQYKLQIPSAKFNAQLTFEQNFYLKNSDSQQNYCLMIQRNASVSEGIVNQQSESIQQIRTQLQDDNMQSQYYDIKFNDTGVFNSNLLGWDISSQTIKQTEVKNRVNLKVTYPQLTYFNILYNQQVILDKNSDVQVANNLTIIGPFTGCIVLDDKGSLKWIDKTTIKFQLYILCPKIIYTYYIELTNYIGPTFNLQQNSALKTVSQRNHFTQIQNKYEISGSIISQKKNTLGQFVSFYPNSYERIITIRNNIVILFQEGSMSYVQLVEESDGSISLVYNDQFCSINYIYSLSAQISIFTNGSIIVIQPVSNEGDQQDEDIIQVVYLQDLLAEHKISVDLNDTIQSVQQYSDISFAISFTKSFIYDIQFGLNENGQLIALKVSIYHYLNAFSTFKYFYKSSRYSIIIGNTKQSNYIVALYDNQQQLIQNQYLIISTYTTPFYYIIRQITTLTEDVDSNYLISVSNLSIVLDVSEYVTLTIKQPDQIQSTVNLIPINTQNAQNQISLLVKNSSQDITSSFYLAFSMICVISFSLIL